MLTPPFKNEMLDRITKSPSPILNSKEWQKIKARKDTKGDETSVNPLCINDNNSTTKQVGELSTKSACWTILSLYVGLGLLSKPYAVAKGGWFSLVILAGFTMIANVSGKLLVSCFETPKGKTAASYSTIVELAFGYWGAIFLIVLTTFEFLGAICMYQLFIWKNLHKLLPGVPIVYVIIISTAVVLPTTWLLKLSEVSWLSLVGFISSLLIILTLVFVRAYYGALDDIDYDNTFGPAIPLSMGIFAMSLGGHAALPQIYGEMEKPHEFRRVLDVTFCVIFTIYASTGVLGYVIYGKHSDIVISANMVDNPGGVLPKITAIFVITKNFLTLNPLMSLLCNNFVVPLGIEESRFIQQIFRSFMFLLTAGVSYLARDALPFVESITGAVCVMTTSFVLPAILIALLKPDFTSCHDKSTSGFIFTFGVLMLGLLTYGAINSLMHPDQKLA